MQLSAEEAAIAQAELAHFQKDLDYYHAHYCELLERYPDEYVAVYDQEIVGANAQIEELVKDLRERGVPPELAVINHPSSEQETWIYHL